jgi:hypothetical protein
MLYNPKWTSLFHNEEPAPQDTGIHSMKSLISWLETKDPEEEYVYANPYGCLLMQYYTSKGLKKVKVTPNELFHGNRHQTLPDGFNQIAMYSCSFGGALKAAERYLKDQY